MMQEIGNYLVSVCAGAIICGVLKSLAPKKSATGAMLRLICGVILAFVAIRPLREIQLDPDSWTFDQMLAQGEQVSEDGKILAMDAMEDIIKMRTQAYILDKAREMNADLMVEVMVEGDPPAPVGVSITGSITPYAKSSLSQVIESELGIAKEDQRWIG